MLETTDMSTLRHLLPNTRTSPHSHPPTPERLLGLAGGIDHSLNTQHQLLVCKQALHDREGRGTEELGPVNPLNYSSWRLGVDVCEVPKELPVGPKGPQSRKGEQPGDQAPRGMQRSLPFAGWPPTRRPEERKPHMGVDRADGGSPACC